MSHSFNMRQGRVPFRSPQCSFAKQGFKGFSDGQWGSGYGRTNEEVVSQLTLRLEIYSARQPLESTLSVITVK